METGATVSSTLLERATEYVTDIFDNQVPDSYLYHNLAHTMRVVDKIQEMAGAAGVTAVEYEILSLGALFHDTGFSRTYEDHEGASAQIAREFLTKEGMAPDFIEEVVNCILATQVSKVPDNNLQMLLKDADTSTLGSVNFPLYTELLRQELNNVGPEQIDKKAWDLVNLQFLRDHKFYTEQARERYNKIKKKNLKEIKDRLGIKKKKKNTKRGTTIATSKSAQTQFKTALRNHIDLSAIADNKANTMLSVTSLIISLTIPLVGTNLESNGHLLIPTVILLFVCVTSITYATLATRPISMRGITTMDDINQRKSNLFFFGNFHRMKIDDYERGIKYIVAHDDLLDSAITRDLFYLGKALGRKYMYLRRCYNVFMFGIIISVLAFAISFAVKAMQVS